MKKISLGILTVIVVLTLSGIAIAAISVKAKENSPAASDKKELSTPAGLEKIEFIHYKKNFAKPETAKNPKIPSCYKFLTPSKVKWIALPVSYAINPTNAQGLTQDFITSAVFNSAETWDLAVSKELMNNFYTIDYTAVYGEQDYKNSISFGNYSAAGVIAVTTAWYNPATKTIIELDVMFDTDWAWGDATLDATKMDLQNIATHELGHGIGLADIYDAKNCSAVTMYGYSDYGDIKKRTLEAPDITGIQTLYGI